MNYDKLLRQITSFDEDRLPKAVRRQLEADEAFREEFNRFKQTSELLGLRRFEQPGEQTRLAMRRQVLRDIRQDPAPRTASPRFFGSPLGIGIAAGLLLMLGFGLLSVPSGTDAPGTTPTAHPPMASVPPAAPAVAPTAEPMSPDAFQEFMIAAGISPTDYHSAYSNAPSRSGSPQIIPVRHQP